MTQVFRPHYDEREAQAVAKVLASGWVGLGPRVAEFECRFAEYVGAHYAIATNSATAALHLSCIVANVQPGDEVLIPAITFVSTAHAVSYCGATPVFVDVEPDTLNLDPEDARRKITPATKAIIPVHYGGHACRMDDIYTLAYDHDLAVIEDAAHACGAEYKGKRIGSLPGSLTVNYSFHAVKNLGTPDGGMIATDRLELDQLLRRLRWCGIDKSTWDRTAIAESGPRNQYSQYSWYYEVTDLGYKYHMNDVTAAIGLVQLDKLPATNARRREIASRYTAKLSSLPWLECPIEHDYTRSAWHNYVIKTDYRDRLNLHLKERDIATGVHYMPLHLHPYYRQRTHAIVPVAERVWTRLLTLPLYPGLTDEEVSTVIIAVKEFEPR